MTRSIWIIDGVHSHIDFSVRHMVVSRVSGRFGRWYGTIAIDENDPFGAEVEVIIDAAGIDTGMADRDAHLRDAEFFDAGRFPHLVFRSRCVERSGHQRFRLVGDLTIRDVTHEVVVDVRSLGSAKEFMRGARAFFTATASIDRRDYGLVWNKVVESGGLAVGNRVNIDIKIEAVKQTGAGTRLTAP